MHNNSGFSLVCFFKAHDYHQAVFNLQPATSKTCLTQTIDDIRTSSNKLP